MGKNRIFLNRDEEHDPGQDLETTDYEKSQDILKKLKATPLKIYYFQLTF